MNNGVTTKVEISHTSQHTVCVHFCRLRADECRHTAMYRSIAKKTDFFKSLSLLPMCCKCQHLHHPKSFPLIISKIHVFTYPLTWASRRWWEKWEVSLSPSAYNQSCQIPTNRAVDCVRQMAVTRGEGSRQRRDEKHTGRVGTTKLSFVMLN